MDEAFMEWFECSVIYVKKFRSLIYLGYRDWKGHCGED